MEKDRNTRIIALVALAVAVVGVSIGFAAFTNTLTISSEADVTPANDGKLNIDFSSDATLVDGAAVANPVVGTPSEVGVVKADDATIDNSVADLPVISGLKAHFTKPGQTVEYDFYIANVGRFDGYLRSITYEDANGGSTGEKIKCVAQEGTTQSYVNAACAKMRVTVEYDGITTSTSMASITGKGITVGAVKPIKVTIAYDKNTTDPENTPEADGAFDVKIGDIKLMFSTVDGN